MFSLFFVIFLFFQDVIQRSEIVEEIIKLYKSGLSREVILQYIDGYQKEYKLSADDLIYLKENNIPDEILREIILHQNILGQKNLSEKFPKEFQNLILKGKFLKKDRLGNILVKEESLEWHDSKDPSKNFSFKISAIKTIWLECKPRAVENFCYEINFSTFDGSKYKFSDFNWENGENKITTEIYNFFKENFKNIIYGIEMESN